MQLSTYKMSQRSAYTRIDLIILFFSVEERKLEEKGRQDAPAQTKPNSRRPTQLNCLEPASQHPLTQKKRLWITGLLCASFLKSLTPQGSFNSPPACGHLRVCGFLRTFGSLKNLWIPEGLWIPKGNGSHNSGTDRLWRGCA